MVGQSQTSDKEDARTVEIYLDGWMKVNGVVSAMRCARVCESNSAKANTRLASVLAVASKYNDGHFIGPWRLHLVHDFVTMIQARLDDAAIALCQVLTAAAIKHGILGGYGTARKQGY